MSIRRLANGDLLVRYQDVGIKIDGYTQNENDENHYIQSMPPCDLREISKCGTCRNPVERNVCTLGRPLDCVECDQRVSTDTPA